LRDSTGQIPGKGGRFEICQQICEVKTTKVDEIAKREDRK
jgi:hypothetical protein